MFLSLEGEVSSSLHQNSNYSHFLKCIFSKLNKMFEVDNHSPSCSWGKCCETKSNEFTRKQKNEPVGSPLSISLLTYSVYGSTQDWERRSISFIKLSSVIRVKVKSEWSHHSLIQLSFYMFEEETLFQTVFGELWRSANTLPCFSEVNSGSSSLIHSPHPVSHIIHT